MHRSIRLALVPLSLMSMPLFAQAKKPAKAPVQQVVPPKTVYWLSAATQSGFGLGGKAPSGGDMMRMAMGGGASGPIKLLDLDLGSKLPPSGPPAASHDIGPAMKMNSPLPLKTPKVEKARETTPGNEDFERPKGKLLLFWGCGETARPGQPIVIDFAKVTAGQVPPNLFGGERVRIANPPSRSSWPTYGVWPNEDRNGRQNIPSAASLLGDHKVTGNYTPQIDFNLTQDWLSGLDLKQAKAASGALGLTWNPVAGATSYFAQMIGAAAGENEADGTTLVFWSSSDVQTFISGLSDYIAPAESARLVGKKQLMPPSQTSCAVPKEAVAAAPAGMLTLVAHGPEQNFVYPPRPSDPKIPWVQDWTVKARFVSRSGAILGMDMGAMSDGGNSRGKKPKCQPSTQESVGSAFGGAVGGALGGLLGGKKKAKDCTDD